MGLNLSPLSLFLTHLCWLSCGAGTTDTSWNVGDELPQVSEFHSPSRKAQHRCTQDLQGGAQGGKHWQKFKGAPWQGSDETEEDHKSRATTIEAYSSGHDLTGITVQLAMQNARDSSTLLLMHRRKLCNAQVVCEDKTSTGPWIAKTEMKSTQKWYAL